MQNTLPIRNTSTKSFSDLIIDKVKSTIEIFRLYGAELLGETASAILKVTARNGFTTVTSKILEVAGSQVSAEAAEEAFKSATYYEYPEILAVLWEFVRDKISENTVLDSVKIARKYNKMKSASKIWELASNELTEGGDGKKFHLAALYNQKNTVSGMLESDNDLSDTAISDSFKSALRNGHTETASVILKSAKVSKTTVDEIVLEAQTAEYDLIKSLVDLDLFYKIKGFKLVAFNNEYGAWSSHVIKYVKNHTDFNIIPITKLDTENEKLLPIFDVFINPGGFDSYGEVSIFDIRYFYEKFLSIFDGVGTLSRHLGTDLSYLDNEEEHMDHEYAYQNVINHAKIYNTSYLGICLGNQHLILNNGGIVAETKTSHNVDPHTLNVIPGSIINFLVMAKHEQSLAVTQGYFPDIKFSIVTLHSYAGVNDNIGDVELGGLSDAGVVEAVAKSFNQFGVQFHPEYLSNERNIILFENIFRIFHIDKSSATTFNDYMQNEWDKAYSNAKCYDDICPAQANTMARDIFTEARIVAEENIITG